jgi:hypothetical protein
MKNRKTIKMTPVFLSFAARDQELAGEVAELLRHARLDVVRVDELSPSGEYTDEVRRALGTSAAVVVVLARTARRRDVPAGVVFEIGAAVGAGKRIFVVTDDLADGFALRCAAAQGSSNLWCRRDRQAVECGMI